VTYREIADRLLDQIHIFDLKEFDFAKNLYIAGGFVASSILSITDKKEYEYGDIDIFFSDTNFLDVLQVLEKASQKFGFEIHSDPGYDLAAGKVRIPEMQLVSIEGALNDQFIGPWEGHMYTEARPLSFKTLVQAGSYEEFARDPVKREKFDTLIEMFEEAQGRGFILHNHYHQFRIHQPIGPDLNFIFVRDKEFEEPQFLGRFDFSCCRAAMDIRRGQLVVSESFEIFVKTRFLKLFHISRNETLIERYFKYVNRFNLSFYLTSTALTPYFQLFRYPRADLMNNIFFLLAYYSEEFFVRVAFNLYVKNFNTGGLVRDRMLFDQGVAKLNTLYGFNFIEVRPQPTPESAVELQFNNDRFKPTKLELLRCLENLILPTSTEEFYWKTTVIF
jgi:hypothetical protein